MKIVAFKTNKPKPFNYRPLYYDQKKEEMEERLKRYSNTEEADSERLKQRIREAWRKQDKSNRKTSQRSMLVYLFIVILLIYLIFFR